MNIMRALEIGLPYSAVIVLALGFCVEMTRFLKRRNKAWTDSWGAGILWVGTALLYFATYLIGLSLVAKRSVILGQGPFMSDRLLLFVWPTIVFLVLSSYRFVSEKRPGAIFAMVWAAGLWVLWTGVHGSP